MKIAIVHDHLGFRGGGERTALLAAMHFKADFITAYASEDTFPECQKNLGQNLIKLSRRVVRMRVVRFFWLRFLFWRKRNLLRGYDMLIASGQTAAEAVASYARPDTIKIVYTHSTPRRVFDQYELSKRMYPLILQPAYAIFAKFWKILYLRSIKKFDVNIANSENVRQRIIDHTGGIANYVIWPPILTDEFKWLGQEDYFFSWGRVDEAKRIELIVQAFKQMPEQKLIVASGGPRLEAVKRLAEGAANIKVLGWVTEKQLKRLVGRCRAGIYIPIDEDAGITHLEANAAGKPFLGVREGGLIESTIEGKTGILIKADPAVNDVIEGVKTMTADWCLKRRKDCETQAKKYDSAIFFTRLDAVLKSNRPGKKILGIDASRCEDPRFPGQGRQTGVEVYASNLIASLVDFAGKKGIRVRLYAPYPLKSFPLEIQKIIPGRKSWTRKSLAAELKNSPPDIFLTPAYYIPKNAPAKSYSVIHDVIFKIEPHKYSFKEKLIQNYALKKNIARSEKIISVSDTTRKELIRLFHLRPEKIITVPMAFSPNSQEGKNIISRSKPLPQRLRQIVYIGRVEKKKSLDVLIRAFELFLKANPDWKMVLAGQPGFGFEGLKELISSLKLGNKIVLPGYISEEEKWTLINQSSLLVHPSSAEGSSITLFEAWDAGLPAIVADIPIMRENAGTAARFFKPGDVKNLAEEIALLTASCELQSKLIKTGQEMLKKLSWNKSAEKFFEIFGLG